MIVNAGKNSLVVLRDDQQPSQVRTEKGAVVVAVPLSWSIDQAKAYVEFMWRLAHPDDEPNFS